MYCLKEKKSKKAKPWVQARKEFSVFSRVLTQKGKKNENLFIFFYRANTEILQETVW